ncbi:type VI secretion system tip protein TssI/VgrG [Thalassobaculum sp.]|uniref:type VI secretion system Vgr family protein n=1 Tax=Thalassobaculum sp. TaxID=2022740 RepID=UPI0032EEE222
MADTHLQQRLDFVVDGQAADTFTVFRVRGREAISELFRFEIEVVSGNGDLNPDAIIGERACLTLGRLQRSRKVYGMVRQMELHDITPHGQYIYRLVLVPRLQMLTLTRQNQIHGTAIEVSVREILNAQLTAADLKGAPAAKVSGRLGLNDFELRMSRSYPTRDYIVQYDESDFAFISRLCEHNGIFYFFAHENGKDSVVFSDSRITFPAIDGLEQIPYRSSHGLANARSSSVFRFVSRSTMVPAQVCLRDYNYRIPNLTLEVDETVDDKGHGVVVEYGAHFRTPQEGRDLARVRAQELACRKHVFEGASDSVQLTAGAVFDLTNHFHNDFNAGYLVTWIEHEATQAIPGIADFAGADHQTSYRNRFECQPKSVEFRPARVTPRPKITGLTNAVVDAAGDGLRAEIGPAGRYKIRQQFDQRGEAAGQASRYMRKAEPYGGANIGLHFPLLKGTEVVMACVNGDPDRPIIVGAMQSEHYPSVVNALNNTKNRIRTASGAVFEIDDGPGSSGGGGNGGTGATLAPQRALEGADAAAALVAPATQALTAQRAESDLQSSGDATSSFARLHVTAGTDSYWRIGSKPSDAMEDGRTPDVSEVGILGDAQPAGGAGWLQYTAGDQSSLISGSSYAQVRGDRLDAVVGTLRTNVGEHRAVSKGEYLIIAKGVGIEASKAPLTATSAPAEVPAGDVAITAAGNFTQIVMGSASDQTAGNRVTKIQGTQVSQTWGSTASFFMGSSISMTLGFQLSVSLSAKVEISAAKKIELSISDTFSIKASQNIAAELGLAIKLNASAEVKGSLADVYTGVANVHASATELKTTAAQVVQNSVVAAAESLRARLVTIDMSI